MKRLVLSMVLMLVAALVAPPSASARNEDAVVGSGKDAAGNHLNLSAKSGPSGEDPKGQVHVRFAFAEEKGEVDCVRVEGNRAAVSGLYRNPVDTGGAPGPVRRFIVLVEDNGNPSSATPDRMAVGGSVATAAPADCGFFLFALGTAPVEQGNLTVRDG